MAYESNKDDIEPNREEADFRVHGANNQTQRHHIRQGSEVRICQD